MGMNLERFSNRYSIGTNEIDSLSCFDSRFSRSEKTAFLNLPASGSPEWRGIPAPHKNATLPTLTG